MDSTTKTQIVGLIAGSISALRASSCMGFPLCNWWMILRGAGWSRTSAPENIFLLLILRYIQQSLETLLRLQEGRQLLAEV